MKSYQRFSADVFAVQASAMIPGLQSVLRRCFPIKDFREMSAAEFRGLRESGNWSVSAADLMVLHHVRRDLPQLRRIRGHQSVSYWYVICHSAARSTRTRRRLQQFREPGFANATQYDGKDCQERGMTTTSARLKSPFARQFP